MAVADPIARLGAGAAVDEQPGRYSPSASDVETLGGGGAGKVALWHDAVLGRDVAVKLAAADERSLFDEARRKVRAWERTHAPAGSGQ